MIDNDPGELTIIFEKANGDKATRHYEYRPHDTAGPDCAINEIVKAVDPKTGARITRVNDQG